MMSENVDMAALAKGLAEAEKSRADADKVRADAEKVRAEADKAKADAEGAKATADKTRAEAEDLRAARLESSLLRQNRLEVAETDLETKQIANQKARSDAEAARVDKLIEQLTGAVPDISSLEKNTVTFGTGKALRQGESTALALKKVAATIAEAVRSKAPWHSPIFVTSEPRLVAALSAYWQLKDETDLLSGKLKEVAQIAEDLLTEAATAEVGPDVGPAPSFGIRHATAIAPPTPGLGTVVAAVAGTAFTQAASLLQMDVAVTSDESDVPASVVQAAVIHELLTLADKSDPQVELTIQHQWHRIPTNQSPLRGALKGLLSQDLALATIEARIKARIERLGDPAARLAKAKETQESKSADERRAAEAAGEQAAEEVARLTNLTDTQQTVAILLSRVKAFIEQIAALPADTSTSPLASAISIEPLATGSNAIHTSKSSSPSEGDSARAEAATKPPDAGTHQDEEGKQSACSPPMVLIVGTARSESHQLVVTRRIFAPRLHISTSLEVEYYLVRGPQTLAAGHATSSASFHALIRRTGTDWTPLDPSIQVTASPRARARVESGVDSYKKSDRPLHFPGSVH